MNKEFESLLRVTSGGRYSTCSLANYRAGCVTFLKNAKYIDLLKQIKHVFGLVVIVPKDLDISFNINKNIRIFRSENVDLLFTLYQNEIHAFTDPSVNDKIDITANIHPTAVIGVDGIKVVIHEGKKILFKHTGNIIIEEDVKIGANSVVHRARLDSTTIKRGTIIGALTNIGHNVSIGEHCVLTTNISMGGSAKIGNNCWIGMGAIIRNSVSVCSNTVIGMGSAVIKDINRSGYYVGNPAKFLRPFKEDRGF